MPTTAEQILRCDLRILPLDPRAQPPAYHSELAAGLDIAAFLPDQPEGVVVHPIASGGSVVMVRTGWSMAIPPGFEAQVRPRSGLATKHAITLPNSPGTIDADYRGEVKVPLINLGREPFVLHHGVRIAQMVIAPVARARVRIVERLDETARGEGGFGSTGLKTG
ncbi:MAG TPA: dUTP diphosphatase [Phycisphaerales bacterium]|nr:dUTP diphosphatase [Phycisphaerales bacterium]